MKASIKKTSILIVLVLLAAVVTAFAVGRRRAYWAHLADWDLSPSKAVEVASTLELPVGFKVKRVGVSGGKDLVILVRGICDAASVDAMVPARKNSSKHDSYLFLQDPVVDWYSLNQNEVIA